jgi:GNAT superfamily N-acetyltransferase
MAVAFIRTTDAGEAADLIASGAVLQRHAHDMQLELRSVQMSAGWLHPVLPPTLRLTPVDRPVVDIARASLGPYSADHVDAAQGGTLTEATATYERLLAGDTAGGVMHAMSSLVIDVPTDSVVAAVIVTLLQAESWWPGGPWVVDLFVVPRLQSAGLGRRLLQLVIARCVAEGYERVGLSVTEGNPAERLYRAVGFERIRSVFVFEGDTDP